MSGNFAGIMISSPQELRVRIFMFLWQVPKSEFELIMEVMFSYAVLLDDLVKTFYWGLLQEVLSR